MDALLPPQEVERIARLVLGEYEGFLLRTPPADGPEEPRVFAARHTAAKTALVHLDTLLKLLRKAPADDGADAEAQRLLAQARSEMEDGEEDAEDAA